MDNPNGFTAGSAAFPPEEATSDAPADNTLYPSSGSSSVAGQPAPVLVPDPGNPDSIAGMSPSAPNLTPGGQPGAPPQQPGGFFKNLVSMLGLVLAQGAKAGVGAPRNAQGPSIAAASAIQQPQEDLRQKMATTAAATSQQQATLNIAFTQFRIHQLNMMVAKMDEEQQDAAFLHGRDFGEEILKKGEADLLVTGDRQAVEQEFEKRQADAQQGKQGLLNLQILPAPGSSPKDLKWGLYSIGKGKLTEPMNKTWGADELGIDPEDFKKAGLLKGSFQAPTGMRTDMAMQAYVAAHTKWVHDTQTAYEKWKTTQANIDSREKEGAANRANRLTIAQISNSTKRAQLALKGNSNDRDLNSATRTLVSANNNLAKLEDKFANVAWSEISDSDKQSILTSRKAQAAAQLVWNRANEKAKNGGAAGGGSSTKVKPGTVATADVINQYKLRVGSDAAKIRKAMQDDGYVIPAAPKK